MFSSWTNNNYELYRTNFRKNKQEFMFHIRNLLRLQASITFQLGNKNKWNEIRWKENVKKMKN